MKLSTTILTTIALTSSVNGHLFPFTDCTDGLTIIDGLKEKWCSKWDVYTTEQGSGGGSGGSASKRSDELELRELIESIDLDERDLGALAPAAAMVITDVAKVSEDLFSVGVNFKIDKADKLAGIIGNKVKKLTIFGTNVLDNKIDLIEDKVKKIENALEWTAKIIVKPSKKENKCCLPDDFGIDLEWIFDTKDDILNAILGIFEKKIQWKVQLVEGILDKFDPLGLIDKIFDKDKTDKREIYSSFSDSRIHDKRFSEIKDLIDLLKGIATKKKDLPNFCWPCDCPVDSSSVSSSSSTTVSSSDSSSSTPVSSTPESSTPVSSTPVSSTPESSTPVSSTPVSSTPVSSTPESSTPVSSTPVSSTPESSTPVGSTPGSSAPESSTPVSSVPESSTPVSSTPVSSTPESSAPESSVPESSTPVSSTPESSGPVSSTPVSSTPESSGPVSSTPVPSGEPSTVTDVDTTIVTVTSCEDHGCTEVPVTTGVTTVTEDYTTYTTYCPLPETSSEKPGSTSTATETTTTLLTVTSCDHDSCSAVTETSEITYLTTLYPTEEAVATEGPSGEAPGGSGGSGESPEEESPEEESPEEESPEEESPEEESPEEESPSGESPSGESPSGESPSGESSEESPSGESPESTVPAVSPKGNDSAPTTVAAQTFEGIAGNNGVSIITFFIGLVAFFV